MENAYVRIHTDSARRRRGTESETRHHTKTTDSDAEDNQPMYEDHQLAQLFSRVSTSMSACLLTRLSITDLAHAWRVPAAER